MGEQLLIENIARFTHADQTRLGRSQTTTICGPCVVFMGIVLPDLFIGNDDHPGSLAVLARCPYKRTENGSKRWEEPTTPNWITSQIPIPNYSFILAAAYWPSVQIRSERTAVKLQVNYGGEQCS